MEEGTYIDGYQYQISSSRKFSKKNIELIRKASKKDGGFRAYELRRNTSYYVRVRTYKKIGGKTYYSGWTAVKKIRTK